MPWTPATANLGSVDENVSFSHTLIYEEVDPLTLQLVSYPVTIVANETNPSSITISGAVISGYYFDSFPYSITYRTDSGELPVVTKFSSVATSSLNEMVSYRASMLASKTYSYTATARNGSTILSTQVFTKTVTNNWTPGRDLLKQYVGYTK